MAQNFGNLGRDIIGSNLFIKGKKVLDSSRNISVRNARVRGDLIVTGNVSTSNTFIIKQTDFDTGTLRITKPGTYLLIEDVLFNPTLVRTDLPVNGFWFAAISIETDNVVIEGNGFDIRLSDEYATLNPANIYTTVLLGNNVFAGALFGVNGTLYPDTPSYVAANNVSINNLNVTYSSHFAIRGSNNTCVSIEGCSFENCLVTTIALQGAVTLKIDNCKFRGADIPPPSIAEQTLLLLLRQTLQTMITSGVVGAVAELAALNAWVDDNPERFVPNETFPSTLYGIFISAGATAVFRFPMNSMTNGVSQGVGGGRECENVKITNCEFTDFTVSARELVTVGTNLPQPPNDPGFAGVPLIVIPLSFLGGFSQLQWRDVFPSGVFAPNAFAHAIAFAGNWIYPQLSGGQQALIPSNTPEIITSVLTSNLALFNANAAPIVGQNDQYIKGLFGIRVVGAVNVWIDNVFMENFESVGPSAVDPTTLPGYGSITPQPIVRNRMNDVWGSSIEVCENVKISNGYWNVFTSGNGWVFALDNPQETHNYIVENSVVSNMSAPGANTSAVQPDGQVFAYTANNSIAGDAFINVTTENLTATGNVTHFPTAGPTITLINAIEL